MMRTVVALAVIAAAAVAETWTRGYGPGEVGITWLVAAVFTLVAAAVALLAIVLVRCLFGFWQGSELPMWPGHRAASVLLVAATLACAPVAIGQTRSQEANLAGFKPTILVPAIAQVWPTHDPVYTYDDGSTGLL
jgi:hypothetical protein